MCDVHVHRHTVRQRNEQRCGQTDRQTDRANYRVFDIPLIKVKYEEVTRMFVLYVRTGDTVAIITVRALARVKESLRTRVSLLPTETRRKW